MPSFFYWTYYMADAVLFYSTECSWKLIQSTLSTLHCSCITGTTRTRFTNVRTTFRFYHLWHKKELHLLFLDERHIPLIQLKRTSFSHSVLCRSRRRPSCFSLPCQTLCFLESLWHNEHAEPHWGACFCSTTMSFQSPASSSKAFWRQLEHFHQAYLFIHLFILPSGTRHYKGDWER